MSSFDMNTTHISENGVLLVGYENQENLGLRSLIACLREQGHDAWIESFFPGKDQEILDAVRRYNPRIIGFSLIFQFTLEDFALLMRYLREHGVTAHFTAGGHFPSLRPTETLELLQDLDSIVRFEGEETLLELYETINDSQAWQGVRGIAFRDGDRFVQTPLRPQIENLDALPFVWRDNPRALIGGLNMASMLASRGCQFNCSFCSIRQFYGALQGKLRRTRSPRNVADEMEALYRFNQVRFFSFQDDDFAVRSPSQKEWIGHFLKELQSRGLSEKIKWKISCRVDDVEEVLFRRMVDHGLFAVYLGVESGNEQGLKTLNKQTTVLKNIEAIDTVKRLSIPLSIGFMLFDPSSTTGTVEENIDFLSRAGSDGYFPINFAKMLPYAGTPIEEMLKRQNRLKGTVTHPDYDFLSSDLDWYAFIVQKLFSKRSFSPDGVQALQNVDFEYRIAEAFGLDCSPDRIGALRKNISRSNMLAVETLRSLLDAILIHGAEKLLREDDIILGLADREWSGQLEVRKENERLHLELLRSIREKSIDLFVQP